MGSAGIGVASTFMSLIGGQQESQAKQQEALNNQKIANAAAADAVKRGNQEAALARLKGTEVAGEQKVAYANSGVDPTTGTASDVQAESKMLTDLDAATAKNNAAREAWGFKTHGLQFAQAAQLEANRSKLQEAGTILGGVGKLEGAIGRGIG